MTIGTASVASTKVRTTVDIGASQSLNGTFSTVSVGNTASQIIRASWWRLGGAGLGGVSVVMGSSQGRWVDHTAVARASGRSAAAMSARTSSVLIAIATAEPSPA